MTEFAKPEGGLVKMPAISRGVSDEFNGLNLKQLAIYNSETTVSRESKISRGRNFFSAS